MCFRGHRRPILRELGSSAPKFLRPSTDARTTTFAVVTPVGRGLFLGGQTRPILRGGVQECEKFGTPC